MEEEDPSLNHPPICCKHADIIIDNDGKVVFGHGCIIHPKVKIIAENGCSINFGDYNIIEENVTIKATSVYNASLNDYEPITVNIGNYNYFKIGCSLINTQVDNCNVFEYRSFFEDCIIESNSIVTAGITLPKTANIKTGSILLNNNIVVSNSTFNEEDHINFITELYKKLAFLLPKQNPLNTI